MADKTKIEWVDHSASPWHGCAEVHKGCDNCYARTMAKRNPDTLGVWGPDGTRVKSASFHANCRRWNEQAKKAGKRATVFPSICDPFEQWDGPILNAKGERFWHLYPPSGTFTTDTDGHADRLPVTMDDLRRELFATIDACPHLDFILLTKRPENVRRMWLALPRMRPAHELPSTVPNRYGFPDYRKNVWLLTSVSDQATADVMIPRLLKCRDLVPVYGVSAEPLLGHIRFRDVPGFNLSGSAGQDLLRGFWVIVGGESGHGARPMHPNWARSIRDQCQAAGVPFFFKQWGEFAPLSNHHVKVPSGNYAFTPSGEKVTVHDKRELHIWPATEIDDDDCFSAVRVGKEVAGRLLDGREWNEYPTKASVTT